MHYLIYCDESDDKGRYYSNFYGGALLRVSDKDEIERRLNAAKGDYIEHEFKWTRISPRTESSYITFVREVFAVVREGKLKIRVMFTQNVNQTAGSTYDEENRFFMLYYQFLKHAFGLQYSTENYEDTCVVAVALDDVPDTREKFDNFKEYLSSLTTYPLFFNAHVSIPKTSISAVDSRKHVILQGVDVVLGAIQFRLNDKHLEKPVGARRRGKRTLAKERVYKQVSTLIREIYPNFNIGESTGERHRAERWGHPYAHWKFVPAGSIKDLSRAKRRRGKE